MKGYSYRINKNWFSLSFVNGTDEKHEWDERNKWSHYEILDKVLKFMKSIGYKVGKDRRIETKYPSLSKDHWQGVKGQLEFKAERYPRGFRIEFYQNVNFKNRNGGEYDFDKFEKAPYLMRLQWIVDTKKIGEFIESIVPGVICDTKIEYKNSEDKIKQHYLDSWHKEQEDMNYQLSDLDGKTSDEYNSKDKDGKIIYNGEIKYFRDYKGRLSRGKVYHNINNMWWVILNDTEYTNMASFELFDPIEETFKTRRIQKSKKTSYETSNNAARKNFNNSFTYKDITRADINKLHEMVTYELEKAVKDRTVLESMVVHPKVRTRFYNTKLQHAYMYVDSHYFTKRECISFNKNGFIGFAGWADDKNRRPILIGFNNWCKYLKEKKGEM